MRMKKILIGVLFLISGTKLIAQAGGTSNGYSAEQIAQYNNNIIKVVPPSPTAASIARYGGLPIGLNTGTFQYSIPIYTLQSGSLSHSISINYSTNGIKVDEIAGRIGLGWSLKAGGTITRKIMDKPDEFGFRHYYNGNTTIDTSNHAYFNYIDISNNDVNADTEPDEYSYNFCGISGKFIQRPDGTFTDFNASGIKIEGTNGHPNLVTTTDGTKYYFAVAETTTPETFPQSDILTALPYPNVPTAYYLTKILALNGDEINFYYTTVYQVKYDNGISQNYSLITESSGAFYSDPYGDFSPGIVAQQNWGGASYWASLCPTPGIVTSIERSKTDIKLVDYITFNGGKVQFYYSGRDDIPLEKKLDYITVIRENDNVKIKQFNFQYTYANASNSYDAGLFIASYINDNINLSKRLFLTSCNEVSNDNTEQLTHSFDYNDMNGLPPRLSFSQDKFGLFNGKLNQYFFPGDTWLDEFNYDKNFGGDRSYDFQYAKKGTLSKITYPTGGYTTVEYEPHQLNLNRIDYAPKIETHAISVGYYDSTTSASVNQNAKVSSGILTKTSNQKLYVSIDCRWATHPIVQDPNSPALNFGESYSLTVSLVEAQVNSNGTYNKVSFWKDKVLEPDANNAEPSLYKIYDPLIDKNNLPDGQYRLILKANGPSLIASVTLYSKEKVADFSPNAGIAGVRVKKVIDYENNQQVNEKTYLYRDWDNANSSSGEGVNYNLYNGNYVSLSKFIGGTGNALCGYNTIHSSSVVQNYFPENATVCYTKVIELNTSTTARNNGGTEYTYNFTKKQKPLPSSFHLPSGRGCEDIEYSSYPNLSQQEVDKIIEDCWRISCAKGNPFIPIGTPYINNDFLTGMLISSKSFSYSSVSSTRKILTETINNYSMDTTNTITDTFFNVKKTGWSTFAYFPNLLKFIDYYVGKYWKCYSAVKLDNTVTKVYDNNGNVITNTIAYDYYFKNYNRCQRKASATFYDSKQETKKIVWKYPFNYGISDPLYTSVYIPMLTQNNVDGLVEEILYKDNTEQYHKKKTLAKLGVTNLYLPTHSTSSFNGNSLEADLTFSSYTLKGLPQQFTTKDGITTTILYGYNNQYPVAKIVGSNSNYATVSSTITQSVLDNPTNDAALRTELDRLRTIAGAFVTTYTYAPLIGVTSETDPQGKTIYYEYDNFNRLKLIRDKDNNILKTFEYKYQETQ